MRRFIPILSTLLAGLTFALGCARQSIHIYDPSKLAGPPLSDYVLHLPGVGGLMGIDRSMTRGLKEGGFDGAEVEIYDWTHGGRGFEALVAYERNQHEAQVIADKIEGRYRADPRARIYLIGHSGGAGLAVWALEKLPFDVRVESLLLLAPALSPRYDLSPALRHVRGKAHAFTSTGDAIVLGAGTRLFGTIDRVKIDAAGRIGFATPDAPEDPQQYEKLVAWPYDPDWMRYGNIGDHIGAMTGSFAREVLAPLLLNGMIAKAREEQAPRS